MFLKLLIISILLLFLSLIFIGIRLILRSDGHFPETHISRNKEMRERGITCATKTDIGCRASERFNGCEACSRELY